MSLWAYLLMFAAAVFAGLVDAIAGGGGIITIPVLLACGLPPAVAIGTNKIGATSGTLTATWQYARRGLVDWRACRMGFALTLIGAALGAWTVQRIDNHVLEKLIPVLLTALLVYMIFRPQVGQHDRSPHLSQGVFHVIFGLGLGFYDGFFGPGTGTFWALAYVLLLGQNFARATAHTKVMNFASGLASMVVFVVGGKIVYSLGLTMAAGQILGARLGSGLVVKRGARFVRPVFIIMAGAVLLKLLYNVFTGQH